MPRGRPQKIRFGSDDPDATWQEIIVIGTDDRVKISSDSARRRSWLAPGNELLAVLRSNRVASLMPYREAAPQVEKEISAAAAEQGTASEATELAIQRRYLRLRVDSDAHIRIPKDIRLCLGLDPVNPAYVRLIIRRDGVTLEAAEESDYEASEDALTGLDLP